MFTNKSCPELESACRGIWFSRSEPLTPASFLPSPLHSGGTGSGQELLHTRLFYFSKTASGPEKNSNGPVRARPLPSPRKSHGAVALSTPLHSAPPLATRREKREREAPGQTVGRPRGRAGARYACAGDPPGQDARPPARDTASCGLAHTSRGGHGSIHPLQQLQTRNAKLPQTKATRSQNEAIFILRATHGGYLYTGRWAGGRTKENKGIKKAQRHA